MVGYLGRANQVILTLPRLGWGGLFHNGQVLRARKTGHFWDFAKIRGDRHDRLQGIKKKTTGVFLFNDLEGGHGGQLRFW